MGRYREPVLSLDDIRELLPDNYMFMSVLRKGGFGQVLKCRTRDTRKPVAVKIPLFEQDTEDEIDLLSQLMDRNMDQRNIVKFYEAFDTPVGQAMIFEKLDLCLLEYTLNYRPLPLSDIRSIIKQMATALQALRDLSYIHCDLKLDNVMVVDRSQRPPQIKLIDFGMALHTSHARVGSKFLHKCNRPPEIILGLPFDESADMWCLGTMVFLLLFSFTLFPNKTEFETLKVMVKLFGQPPDHLLDQALWTVDFFKSLTGSWRLKTDDEYILHFDTEVDIYKTEKGASLQNMIELRLEDGSPEEVEQIPAFSDLLQQMLQMDGADRITPAQILEHPFICYKSEPAENATAQSSSDLFDIDFYKPLTRYQVEDILPEEYYAIKLLGDGKFGQMVRCKKPDHQIVTCKLPYPNNQTRHEVKILRKVVEKGLEQMSIIHLLDTVETGRGDVLLFEWLNMSLSEYMEKHKPLPLNDIRTIVEQTSTALLALNSLGIIHTGVSLESIWICSGKDQPLEIKLADFGGAIQKKKAVPGMTAQLVNYRAPELLLGLPFDSAIDMWSLGCMLVTMLTGFEMFPSRTEYETLRTIIHFFGVPPNIDKATKREECFYTENLVWRLKSVKRFEKFARLAPGTIQKNPIEEYISVPTLILLTFYLSLFSTDPFPKLKALLSTPAVNCIALVEAMLIVDPTLRMTPVKIQGHSFIW
ncbi:hypothetical protein WMY93_012054 [Mugilogobius chulae]|uniref:Protein kinase domain-containing protein n=1 Tax=Mugilogobius chulae TaxID=88201 RepID=A0AAW0PAG5_9GOBI